MTDSPQPSVYLPSSTHSPVPPGIWKRGQPKTRFGCLRLLVKANNYCDGNRSYFPHPHSISTNRISLRLELQIPNLLPCPSSFDRDLLQSCVVIFKWRLQGQQAGRVSNLVSLRDSSVHIPRISSSWSSALIRIRHDSTLRSPRLERSRAAAEREVLDS